MKEHSKCGFLVKAGLACFLSGIFMFGTTPNVSRADEVSLSINPPLIEMIKNGPEEVNAKVVLKNSGASTLDIKVLLRPFRAVSEDGSIEIIPENQVPISYKNLFSKVKITDNGLDAREFQIAPEQTKNLEINISSDFSVESADYYFTIIFMAETDEVNRELNVPSNDSAQDEVVSGQSVIEAGIGANVILSTNKDFIPKAEIAEFSTPGTTESGPVTFLVKIKNNSQRIIRPRGVILIKNMFGQAIGRVDLEQANILADSIRSLTDADYKTRKAQASGSSVSDGLTAVWPEEFLLGLYSADLSLALTDKGPVLNKTIYFVGLPVITVIIFLIFVGFIISIVLRVNHYLKRQK